MTAMERVDDGPGQRPHPLRPGASPRTVHDWLLAADRPRFVADYQAALDEARTALDLSRVHETVEEWRCRAVAQCDPEAFRRTVLRAAEFYTGHPVPDDEPFEVTRTKAGMQPTMYRVVSGPGGFGLIVYGFLEQDRRVVIWQVLAL